MIKYEYVVIPLPIPLKEQQVLLNAQGNEGWELIWIGSYTAYFKRVVAERSDLA